MQGTFDEFPLDVVMTVLASSRRTGVLRFQGPPSGSVHLHDGTLVHAESQDGVPVGRLVQQRGLATAEQWETALAEGGGVLTSLVAEGADAASLRQALADHATDVVFRQLVAGDGEFRFEAGAARPVAGEEGVPAVDVVASARAHLKRWDALQELVGPLSTAFALDEGRGEGVTLTADEWRLVTVVDGRRGLHELTAELAAPLLTTAESVASLIRRGLLQLQ